jgi:hypothetical protein
MQIRTDPTNCLPHGKLGVPQAKDRHRDKTRPGRSGAPKAVRTPSCAVCDGAMHRAATEERLSLGFPNILAKRSDLGSLVFMAKSLDVITRVVNSIARVPGADKVEEGHEVGVKLRL